MTDLRGVPGSEWLIDPAHPLLTDRRLAQVADPRRPDRAAWNTFRILALWDTDSWVPSLLETACGAGNPLSRLEWAGGSVTPWGGGLGGPGVCDVSLDGPAACVTVVCTLSPRPRVEDLRAGAMAALDRSLHGAREAGLVAVVAPGAADLSDDLELATQVELHDGRLVSDVLDGAVGAATWRDLGRLALDLAEEADPDLVPTEQVRQLVVGLGEPYGGLEL